MLFSTNASSILNWVHAHGYSKAGIYSDLMDYIKDTH